MKKKSYRRSRSKIWMLFVVLVLGAIVFHKHLLLIGCRAALHRLLSDQEVHYHEMQWEDNVLVISGLHVKDPQMGCVIDRIEVRPEFHALCFEPRITLVHPQITFTADDEGPASAGVFLARSRFFAPRWEIKNGVMSLSQGSRFYFLMAPGVEKDAIGEFVFSSDPDPMVPPIFSIDLHRIEKDFRMGFRLQESDLGRLLPLSALLFRQIPPNWERVNGDVELEGLLILDSSLSLKELHFRGEGKEISLSNAALGIDLHCDELGGTFSYPANESSFWGEALSAAVILKNGNFVASAPLVLDRVVFRKLEGNLLVGPGKDPELELKGKIQVQNQELPFSCVGKGGIQPDETYWSEIQLDSSSMQTTLSLCSHPDNDLSLHLQVDNADTPHLEIARALCRAPGKCLEGTANFAATFLLKKGDWSQATVENCRCEKIRWSFPEENATFSVRQMTAEATFSYERTWELQDLHWQMEGGEYRSPKFSLSSIAMDLGIDGKVLRPSQIDTVWEGLQTHIALTGDYENNLITLLAQGTLAEEPIEVSAMFAGKWPTFAFKEARWKAEHLTEKSYARLAALFISEITLAGHLKCEGNLTPSGAKISIGGDDVLAQHPLAQLYLPKAEGAQFTYDRTQDKWFGTIPLDQGRLKYLSSNLLFENLEGRLHIDGGRLTAPGFYAECEGLALRGDADLSEGQLLLSTSQVAGTVPQFISLLKRFSFFQKVELPINGSFYSEKEGFVLWTALDGKTEPDVRFKGHFQGLQFPINAVTSMTDGECDLSFSTNDNRLVVERGEGKWKLIDGAPLTVSLKRLIADPNSVDFALKVSEGRKEWAHLEGNASATPSSQWEIAFHNPATSFDSTALNVQKFVLGPQLKLSSFKMSPLLKCRDIPLWAALFQRAGFLPSSFSVQSLTDLQCEGSLQTDLFTENASKGFSIHAHSRDFCVRGKPLPGFQFKATRRGEIWHIEQLESADLSLKGKVEENGSELLCREFQGKWQGIEWKGSGKMKPDQKIFSCQFDTVKGDLAAWGIPCSGTFVATAAISGDASQFSGEVNLSADVTAPVRLTAKNKKTARFSYDDSKGLIWQGIDLQCKDKQTGETLADLRAEKFSSSNIEKLQFSLARAMVDRCVEAKILPGSLKDFAWEDRLEGEGDLQIGPKVTFQASLKPGAYGIGKYNLPFEQLQVRYEKDVIDVRGKSQINQKPLWTVLQTNIAKEPFGAIKFLDNPKAEGLKCSFTVQNSGIVWDSIQGSCYGVQCQLAKSSKRKIPFASVLSGSVKLDGSTLGPILPKDIGEAVETFQFGNGYEWQGDLVVFQEAKKGFQLSGALTGNAFELLGYRFQRLQGNIDATPERIAVTDLKIEDPSGSFGLKKIAIDKQDDWNLYIPQIVIRHLQPSLMQKVAGDPKTVKPFTIKNGILSEIRGKLGDKSTLEGVGKLAFTNQFKKESSLFDVPIDFIKNIGLDPGLLTPVQGELDLELRGDKFYLLSLTNAYSEGGRTEFYLAPRGKEPSFIDLSGKMHIDLKMRQEVMLKLAEAFTLTIRGTLEKPRYGLQH